jgi:hypothetical protein
MEEHPPCSVSARTDAAERKKLCIIMEEKKENSEIK